MKAFIILVILATVASIFFEYNRNKNVKKLFISLATFGIILSFVVLGNIVRQVLPLFMVHIVFVIMAWGGLLVYILRDKYYWWIVFSPAVTIAFFLLLELLMGSGHEGMIPQG